MDYTALSETMQNDNHEEFVDPRLLLVNSGSQHTDGVSVYILPNTVPTHNSHLTNPLRILNHEGHETSSSALSTTLEDPGRLDGINHGSQASSASPQSFNCTVCGTVRSMTKRDFERHEETRRHLEKTGKSEADSGAKRFHCSVPTCKYAKEKSFTRKDNLKRHSRDVHNIKEE